MPRLPDGVELPDAIDLYAGDDAGMVAGELVRLDRDTAKREIDLRWWVGQPGVPARARRGEIDRSWEWHKLVGTLRSDAGNTGHAWGVRVDGRIQGAVLYQLPVDSDLDPGAATLIVFRLATAPWNRGWLNQPRAFAGVGTGLLRPAVYHSYRFGLGGRVTVEAADDPDLLAWYSDFGFRLVSQGTDGITVLELTPGSAAVHLPRP